MTKIQLAIQGGGAKFINLVAAAEPFHRAQKEGHLGITRVAGTSAGSIVAALVAVDASFSRVNEFFNSKAGNYVAKGLSTLEARQRNWFGRMRTLVDLYVGKPLVDPNILRSFLVEMFNQALEGRKIPQTVGAVAAVNGTELIITASDIVSFQGKNFSKDEDLIDSILHSCAVPFVFRTHNDVGTARYVDGGLCDNLPVDCLSSDVRAHGSVFAISPVEIVRDSLETSEAPALPGRKLLNYAGSLFSAPINHGVVRSRKLVGSERTIEFDSSLGTFDFRDMLKQGSESRQYKDIFKVSGTKIANYIRTVNALDADFIDESVSADGRLSLPQLTGLLDSIKEDRTLLVDRNRTAVMANCLRFRMDGNDNEMDLVRSDLHFRITSGRLRVIESTISSTTDAMHRQRWSLYKQDSGENIDAYVVPVRSENGGALVSKIHLVLKQPIEGREDSETYVLRTAYMVRNAMKGLRERAADFISAYNPGAADAHAQLFLLLPKEFLQTVYPLLRDDGVKLDTRPVPPEDYRGDEFISGALGFKIVGIQVDNVPPGRKVVVDFKARG